MLQILYRNVAHPKLSAFIKTQKWLNLSGEYLMFPRDESEFKGGVHHYLSSIEEVRISVAFLFIEVYKEMTWFNYSMLRESSLIPSYQIWKYIVCCFFQRHTLYSLYCSNNFKWLACIMCPPIYG